MKTQTCSRRKKFILFKRHRYSSVLGKRLLHKLEKAKASHSQIKFDSDIQRPKENS
jgi:hypothetical protein